MARLPIHSERLIPVDHTSLRQWCGRLVLGGALGLGLLASAVAEVTAPDSTAQRGNPSARSEDILYTVRPNDTLIGIARERLDTPQRWQDVQRYNGIAQPRRIPPGTILKIRPEWLKPSPVMATLATVSNEVQLDRGPAKAGNRLGEGSLIRTGRDSTAVVDLPDGTQLRIPSASQVRLERLRAYHGAEDLEVLFRLEKGSIEPRTPPRQRSRSLRIRTPSGNAAVRGTHFRVKAQAERSTIEVLRGQVEAGNRAGAALVEQGNGAYFSKGTAPKVEPLLPPPDLGTIDGRQLGAVTPTIEIPALEGAVAYHVEVSTREDFNTLLLDTRSQQPFIQFQTGQDGTYYLRVRGISAHSLEGHDSVARVEVLARPLPPRLSPTATTLPAGLHTLAWQDEDPAHDDRRRYRLQIASDADFRHVLHDQILSQPQSALHLHAHPPLTRWWRVAAIENNRQGPFSAPAHFMMQKPAPINEATPRPVVKTRSQEPVRTGSGDFLLLGY
ncbi:MAG: FecR domain-containing protein [Lautropia sp.]|nr:FecR domain-containing protein [Lautropia sp.]